jgi:hypothetical protein
VTLTPTIGMPVQPTERVEAIQLAIAPAPSSASLH